MPIIFKLVDFNKYEIRDNFAGVFNKSLVNELYSYFGISIDEIIEIKFIINDIELLDNDIVIESDELCIIILETQNKIIFEKLTLIFIEKGLNMEAAIELNDPLTHIKDEKNELFHEDIVIINNKTKPLIDNPDFKKMLQIYKTNSEMFSIFLKFIQNNDFIPDTEENPQNMDYYTSLVPSIAQLDLGYSYELILERLVIHSGHVNLTIRSLLAD